MLFFGWGGKWLENGGRCSMYASDMPVYIYLSLRMRIPPPSGEYFTSRWVISRSSDQLFHLLHLDPLKLRPYERWKFKRNAYELKIINSIRLTTLKEYLENGTDLEHISSRFGSLKIEIRRVFGASHEGETAERKYSSFTTKKTRSWIRHQVSRTSQSYQMGWCRFIGHVP